MYSSLFTDYIVAHINNHRCWIPLQRNSTGAPPVLQARCACGAQRAHTAPRVRSQQKKRLARTKRVTGSAENTKFEPSQGSRPRNQQSSVGAANPVPRARAKPKSGTCACVTRSCAYPTTIARTLQATKVNISTQDPTYRRSKKNEAQRSTPGRSRSNAEAQRSSLAAPVGHRLARLRGGVVQAAASFTP